MIMYNYSQLKKSFILSLLSLISLFLFFQNCSPIKNTDVVFAVTPKGSREIGIDFLYTTLTSDFNNNLIKSKAAGASVLPLILGWNQIEPKTPNDCTSPGTYIDPYNSLTTFDTMLNANNIKMLLAVVPITTNLNMLPSNLNNRPLNDSLVLCRYQKMLTYVFSKISNINLYSFQVGNELDIFSTSNTAQFWSDYSTFLSNAAAAAKILRPGLKVGVIGTLYGAIGATTNAAAKSGLQQLFSISDYVAVTYYPVNSDMSVKDSSIIESELKTLTDLYPTKSIYITEFGFQSGSISTNSSEIKQQKAFAALFTSWDIHSSQISLISFLRLNDLSHLDAQNTASQYGLPGNLPFTEFIETLGLRTYDNRDKPGYLELISQARARGW